MCAAPAWPAVRRVGLGGDETAFWRARAPHDRAPKVTGLDLLSQGHTLARVRKVLGINRVTIFRWRQNDPSFSKAHSEAMEAGTDVIEQEAQRRAVDGYVRPVFQRGELVGFERVYSDILAALLLRGRRPEVFREGTSRDASTTSITIHGGLAAEDADRH
jgi:hypothetical protein